MLALAAAAYAAAVGWTGGFEARLGPIAISSRNVTRPAALAAVAFILFLLLDHRRARQALAAGWRRFDSPASARWLAGAAACWTLVTGLLFGTYTAGGSDSYGYVSQALLLSRGELTARIDIRPEFTWTDAEASLIPLGYAPASQRGVMSPSYPPGLPLLMAAVHPLGDHWMYVVVPVFGMLAIVCVWRAGVRLGDPLAGAIGAVLLSVSPSFLSQLVQPMSDVPATACWLAALIAASKPRASSLVAGVATGLAILIRPNLAPLALVVAGLLLAQPGGSRALRAVRFVVPVGVAAGLLMAIQQVRYGSPFLSGYGPLHELYGAGHIATNLQQYARWLTASQTPLIWAALAAPLLLRRAENRRFAWALAAFAAGVWAAYLPYVPFQPDEWHYIRFLLPAIAVMVLFAAVVLLRGVRLLHADARMVVTAALVIAVVLFNGRYAVARGIFQLRESEQKYAAAGEYVRQQLPESTYVLTVLHSGSLRLYPGRSTVRWDFVAPEDLTTVIGDLERAGFTPVLVGDPDEIDAFRTRFATSPAVGMLRRTGVSRGVEIYAFE